MADIDKGPYKDNASYSEDFDKFLVDIHKRHLPVVLASETPEQELSYEIYQTLDSDKNCDHPVIYKNQVSDIGLVVFDYNKSALRSKALNAAHIRKITAFLYAWKSLSEKQKDKALKPIMKFHNDVENFWKQMDAPLQTIRTFTIAGDVPLIPHVFSKDPTCPFYNFARKIKKPTTPTHQMKFVEMIQLEDNGQKEGFTHKITDEQLTSKEDDNIPTL